VVAAKKNKPVLSKNGRTWFEVEGVRYYIDEEEENEVFKNFE